MRPDVVILVTGDADFAYLAIELRRRGIRVEVALSQLPGIEVEPLSLCLHRKRHALRAA
jgi:hypothetical protein